jgi:hypothetical protein
MTIRQTITTDTVMILVFAGMAGAFLSYQFQRSPVDFHVISPVQTVVEPTVSPLPIPNVTSQISPDGTKKVILETQIQKNKTLSYTLWVTDGNSDVNNDNRKKIYSDTLLPNESAQIPFNSWSPDDQYFFIEKLDANGSQALVFSASGKPLAQDQFFLDAKSIFINKRPGVSYKRATGWASPTLLVVNTTNQKGNTQSFWLEVPSTATIPLASVF